MTRLKFAIAAAACAVLIVLGHTQATVEANGAAKHPPAGARFVVDVAMDGSTWRFDDGTNPFYPVFTGQLFRGKTFIVSGKIYRAGTLSGGGDFGSPGNPSGPETSGEIGTWVCRGTVNLDIGEIAAGGYPHVYSTQFFNFNSGDVIVTEGPEGGAELVRAVIGGSKRFRAARGDVVETPLGVNTSNLFNVRFRFTMQ
jgi:hypothetical protein